MSVQVKICGIRSVASALTAVTSGADYIGINFVPTSKRRVSLETAKEIAAAVKGKVQIVGVFQNADPDYINEIVRQVGLDYVQLHGEEKPEHIKLIKAKVIKAILMKKDMNETHAFNEMNQYDAAYFLLDREVQGEGEPVGLETAHHVAQTHKIFLAGGLNPNTAGEAVQTVKPFAVDAAGGIETDGNEDHEKIKQFILNAKGVEL
jgi:phosphoribosylanthranilate isomerase